MTAIKTRSIAPALLNLGRIRNARNAAEGAAYDRASALNHAADLREAGKDWPEVLAAVYNAGFVTGHLEATAETAQPDYALIAAVLDRQEAGGR